MNGQDSAVRYGSACPCLRVRAQPGRKAPKGPPDCEGKNKRIAAQVKWATAPECDRTYGEIGSVTRTGPGQPSSRSGRDNTPGRVSICPLYRLGHPVVLSHIRHQLVCQILH